jgi:hypothetical protein
MPTGEIPEPTEAQKIKKRVARDALSAALGGDTDEESRNAAWAQFRQTGSVYAETRDLLNVPDDAGVYRDRLAALLRRIPEGWGRRISCGAGWYPIICDLADAVSALDPDFALHQVKEKFGTLRFYAAIEDREHWPALKEVTRRAEELSGITCELCGEPGMMHSTQLPDSPYAGRVQTLCASCAADGDSLGRAFFPRAQPFHQDG